MKKRMTCAALALALCLGLCPAFAAQEKFPAVNTYPGYADVAESDWFYSNAKLCYEIGLMNGTDKGFEPGKTLTIGECTAIAARMRSALTGEPIPPLEDAPWYLPYAEYMRSVEPLLTGLTAHADDDSTRYGFLRLLDAAISGQEGLLEPINEVEYLPDPGFRENTMVLAFYNAGILTGTDKYGTFDPDKSLTRAEAAAMVSRIARPELRLRFTPEPAAPDLTDLFLEAAYLPSGAVVLVGVTSEQFLAAVNESIARWEAALGADFNWHADGRNGKTVLECVKEETLSALGVTAKQGGELYRNFDYQVYYSRLIDLTGETLQPDYAVKPGGMS